MVGARGRRFGVEEEEEHAYGEAKASVAIRYPEGGACAAVSCNECVEEIRPKEDEDDDDDDDEGCRRVARAVGEKAGGE